MGMGCGCANYWQARYHKLYHLKTAGISVLLKKKNSLHSVSQVIMEAYFSAYIQLDYEMQKAESKSHSFLL